jgi:hypothetical protein
MATVVVTPLSQINVRVGPGSPAAVQSTAQFVGASDQTAQIQRIYDVANSASATANTALSQVVSGQVYANGAFRQANAAYMSQNTTGIYANSAYSSQNTTGVYANSAFTAANTAASDALAYAIALG